MQTTIPCNLAQINNEQDLLKALAISIHEYFNAKQPMTSIHDDSEPEQYFQTMLAHLAEITGDFLLQINVQQISSTDPEMIDKITKHIGANDFVKIEVKKINRDLPDTEVQQTFSSQLKAAREAAKSAAAKYAALGGKGSGFFFGAKPAFLQQTEQPLFHDNVSHGDLGHTNKKRRIN